MNKNLIPSYTQELYQNNALHFKIGPLLKKNFESVENTRLNKDTKKIRRFILFGGRSYGKTTYIIWLNGYLYEYLCIEKKHKINFIYVRNFRDDIDKTFNTFLHTIPQKYKGQIEILSKLKGHAKIGRMNIFFKHFNLSQRSLKTEQHHLGDYYPKSDFNIFLFDEAHQLASENQAAFKSILLVASKTCRFAQISFYTFNPGSILNPFIYACAKKAPYNDKEMRYGKHYIDRIDKENNTYYFRSNYLLVKGNSRIFTRSMENELLNNQKGDTARTILYGDDGAEKLGFFKPYLKKIGGNDEAEIMEGLATSSYGLEGTGVAGLDLAHLQDRTALVIGIFGRDYKHLTLVECLYLIPNELNETERTTEGQLLKILKFLMAKEKYGNIPRIKLVCDGFQALEYSVDNKIRELKLTDGITLKYIKEKHRGSENDVFTRLSRVRTQIDKGRLGVNKRDKDKKANLFWLEQELQTIKVSSIYGRLKLDARYSDVYDALANILYLGRSDKLN